MGWGCLTEIARNRISAYSGLPKRNRRIGVELTTRILRPRSSDQQDRRELE